MAGAVFIQEGSAIDHTPSSDLPAGTVVVQAELVGVVVQAIAANELGALKVEGIFQFPKKSTDTVNTGDDMFWDDTLDEATTNAASGANKLMGKAVKDAGSGVLTVDIRLAQ